MFCTSPAQAVAQAAAEALAEALAQLLLNLWLKLLLHVTRWKQELETIRKECTVLLRERYMLEQCVRSGAPTAVHIASDMLVYSAAIITK